MQCDLALSYSGAENTVPSGILKLFGILRLYSIGPETNGYDHIAITSKQPCDTQYIKLQTSYLSHLNAWFPPPYIFKHYSELVKHFLYLN